MFKISKNTKAASLTEYGVIVSLVSITALGVIFDFGSNVREAFAETENTLSETVYLSMTSSDGGARGRVSEGSTGGAGGVSEGGAGGAGAVAGEAAGGTTFSVTGAFFPLGSPEGWNGEQTATAYTAWTLDLVVPGETLPANFPVGSALGSSTVEGSKTEYYMFAAAVDGVCDPATIHHVLGSGFATDANASEVFVLPIPGTANATQEDFDLGCMFHQMDTMGHAIAPGEEGEITAEFLAAYE